MPTVRVIEFNDFGDLTTVLKRNKPIAKRRNR